MDKLIELGHKIRQLRKSKNLTQAQLAHKINKDREAISRLERGAVNPSYLFLLELAEGLEMDIKDLMP